MMILSFIAATSISAQRGHGHTTSTTTYNYSDDRYYDSSDRYNDTWDNNFGYSNGSYHSDYNANVFRRYRRDEGTYYRMNRNDKRKLRRLEKKLRERKRCALEDGFVSDRDFRRVREVEIDINRLYARYNYRGYRNGYNGYGNSGRRGNRSCR